MNESEIKSLLENVEVTPSARCWDAIEGNLAAAAGESAAANSAAKGAAGKAAGKISATAVKAIVGAGIAGAVAAGAIVSTILLSNKNEQIDKSISKQIAITEITAENQDTKTIGNGTLNIEERAIRTTSHDNAPELVTPAEKDVEPEVLDGNTSTENAATQQVSLPTPTPATPVNTSSPAPSQTAVQPKPTSNTPQTASTTAMPTTSSVISSKEDPVLAGRNDIPSAPPVAIEIPNIITPNGDGYNDLFVIKGIEHCENSKLIIRSRSGAVVFQTTDYQNNWNAENAPDGSYYYQFFYTVNGIQQTRSGQLTIMR